MDFNIGNHISPAFLHKPADAKKKDPRADEECAFVEKGKEPVEVFNNDKYK